MRACLRASECVCVCVCIWEWVEEWGGGVRGGGNSKFKEHRPEV